MAGYRKLNRFQKMMYIGRTKKMRDAGFTIEQIADELKRHKTEIEEWFNLIDVAEAKKANQD